MAVRQNLSHFYLVSVDHIIQPLGLGRVVNFGRGCGFSELRLESHSLIIRWPYHHAPSEAAMKKVHWVCK